MNLRAPESPSQTRGHSLAGGSEAAVLDAAQIRLPLQSEGGSRSRRPTFVFSTLLQLRQAVNKDFALEVEAK